MNTITHNTPNVKIGKTKQLITSYAGLVPILRAIASADAFNELTSTLRGLKMRKRGFSVEEKLLNFFAHTYVGAKRLEDFAMLRNDEALTAATNIRFMLPTTAGEFLRNFTKTNIARMRQSNFEHEAKWYERKEITTLIIDGDSSVHETHKKCSKYAYTKEKAFNPMYFLESGERKILDAHFRNGNASPMSDIHRPMKRILKRYDFADTIFARFDSAFYQTDFVRLLESDERVRYTITARQDASVKETITTITKWTHFDDAFGSEVGEAAGIIGDVPYRMIVKRKPLPEDNDEQRRLFNDGRYEYYCLATNFGEEEKSAEEVMRFHNGRGNAENFFKELKNDYSLHHFPCSDFYADAAYFYLRIIAFNFFRALLKSVFFPKNWSSHFLGTLIFRFIHVAGKVVRRSRQIHLYIFERYAFFDEFAAALDVSSFSLI
jgi:hypothetical protein